jgi:hypothetical protein
MIELLAYFLPMAITVALVYEYRVVLDDVAMFVFAPFFNIIVMAMVAAEALNKIALREEDE